MPQTMLPTSPDTSGEVPPPQLPTAPLGSYGDHPRITPPQSGETLPTPPLGSCGEGAHGRSPRLPHCLQWGGGRTRGSEAHG